MNIQMNSFYERITYIFDPLHNFYEHERLHRKLSAALVVFFICSLVLIEFNRQHWLPAGLKTLVPMNHFSAVEMAFSIILVLEVISLIFVLPCSFSKSLGKQFEILSLILVRNAFKELSYFPEPITMADNVDKVFHIIANGFGAIVVFGLLGLYYKLQKRAEDGIRSRDLYGFVAAKKAIALFLLIAFFSMGLMTVADTINGAKHGEFFHDFYTLLILTDILIVLVSQIFNPSSKFVFRNSGYALSTLMIRIALVAPVYYNVVLGITAIGFAILLTLVSNYLFTNDHSWK